MKCLHCGYCCIQYSAIIVDNPKLGIILSNLSPKISGVKCKHLQGESPGNYKCAIHHYSWYKDTPCAEFTQVEYNDSNCRMGEYILSQQKSNKIQEIGNA